MQFAVLPTTFYELSAEVVAPKLLAHWLIRRTPDGVCGGAIVEVEAYLDGDPASHVSADKKNEAKGSCFLHRC